MKVLVNTLSEKKDLVKAGNAVLGFKDVLGEKMVVTGVIIFEKEEVNEKSGEVEAKTVCCLKRKDGEFITSISPTVKNSLQMIIEAYTAEEIAKGIEVVVKSKSSNAGRDFFYVDLV